MRARAVDANQAEIVKTLRRLGVWCWPTSALGNGFPDLLCVRAGKFVLLEVKDGKKKPSARKLTPAEEAFISSCPGPVCVVKSLEEALAALGVVYGNAI